MVLINNLKKTFNTFTVFVLSLVLFLIFAFFVEAAYWAESPVSSSSSDCSAEFHVMCAEKDSNYDVVAGLIPYYDNLTSGSLNSYCVIKDDVENNFHDFDFVTAVNLSELKKSPYVDNEICSDFNFGYGSKHYDDNCNGADIFERLPSGKLDYSKYIEGGFSYSVLNDTDNIDNFDIVSGCGSFLIGNIVDSETKLYVENANVSFYFKNSVGDLKKYLTVLSDEKGFYSTLIERSILYDGGYELVSLIPITSYIITVKHSNYEDYIFEYDLSTSSTHNFELDPLAICTNDCTYTTGNVCRKECDGINGCDFNSGSLTGFNMAEELHLLPKNLNHNFEFGGHNYTVSACEGLPYSSSLKVSSGSICPEGQDAWKTSKIVKKNGQVLRMVVTMCQ